MILPGDKDLAGNHVHKKALETCVLNYESVTAGMSAYESLRPSSRHPECIWGFSKLSASVGSYPSLNYATRSVHVSGSELCEAPIFPTAAA